MTKPELKSHLLGVLKNPKFRVEDIVILLEIFEEEKPEDILYLKDFTLDQVIESAALSCDTTLKNAKSNSRKRVNVRTRQFVFYFYKKYREYSLDRIGGFFGKNHATALHGIRTIQNELNTYPPTKVAYNNFINKLKTI